MSQTTRVVVLVRHGETEWTRTKQHTGRQDIPLNEAGRREGELLRHRLAAWPFTRVFVSPLSRARDTACSPGSADRAEVRPDLMECDYGAYEGRTRADILRERPEWNLWRDGCPQGETAGAGRRPGGPGLSELRGDRRGRGDLRPWASAEGARGPVAPRAGRVRGTPGPQHRLGERARPGALRRGHLAVERREPSDAEMTLASLMTIATPAADRAQACCSPAARWRWQGSRLLAACGQCTVRWPGMEGHAASRARFAARSSPAASAAGPRCACSRAPRGRPRRGRRRASPGRSQVSGSLVERVEELDAVHHRHHEVQEHDAGVGRGLEQLQRLDAVLRRRRRRTRPSGGRSWIDRRKSAWSSTTMTVSGVARATEGFLPTRSHGRLARGRVALPRRGLERDEGHSPPAPGLVRRGMVQDVVAALEERADAPPERPGALPVDDLQLQHPRGAALGEVRVEQRRDVTGAGRGAGPAGRRAGAGRAASSSTAGSASRATRKRASASALGSEGVHLDVLVHGVEALAARTEPVDRGDAHRREGARVARRRRSAAPRTAPSPAARAAAA